MEAPSRCQRFLNIPLACREPRAHNREPSAQNRKLGAQNRELGAQNRQSPGLISLKRYRATVEGINLATLWQRQKECSQREHTAPKEGPLPAGEHNKYVILQAGGQRTLGSDSSEASSAPPNHTVFKLMNIG